MISAILIWIFVFLFFIISWITRGRPRILPSLFILIFVTFFASLSPSGEVLLTLGSFYITQDSLFLGLRRSGILIGMVFFSRTIVSFWKKKKASDKKSTLVTLSDKKKTYGVLKSKLTLVFYYLDLLTSKKISFKHGNMIQAIDERLCEIWEMELPQS